MKKAQYILNYFLAKRKLKPICFFLGDLPYKYIFSLVKKNGHPSTNIKNALLPIIAPSFWYEEADSDFVKLFKNVIVFNNSSQNFIDLSDI